MEGVEAITFKEGAPATLNLIEGRPHTFENAGSKRSLVSQSKWISAFEKLGFKVDPSFIEYKTLFSNSEWKQGFEPCKIAISSQSWKWMLY